MGGNGDAESENSIRVVHVVNWDDTFKVLTTMLGLKWSFSNILFYFIFDHRYLC